MKDSNSLEDLEKGLGYRFADTNVLLTALTHSSWANEHGGTHNERLEFLGDAVLELAVSSRLFALHPEAREGELTRMRSALVNESTLADVARALRLDERLRLARGEENQGGRQRDAQLSDAMEAVLGGVYLDGGFQEALKVVDRLYAPLWPTAPGRIKRKDFKTRLQEVTQRISRGLPVYMQEDASGPEHARIFSVRVELPDGRVFRAAGAGLKRAEQEAARTALAALGEEPEEEAPNHMR